MEKMLFGDHLRFYIKSILKKKIKKKLIVKFYSIYSISQNYLLALKLLKLEKPY